MKIVIDIVSLILKCLVLFFLTNFTMKFQLFFNYYTIVLFCLSVVVFGISAYGIQDTLRFIAKSVLPSLDIGLVKGSTEAFYRFSYISGFMISISGLIIILSDLERMLASDNNVYEAFAINLLPLLYSILYSEFFCKTLKIKSEN